MHTTGRFSSCGAWLERLGGITQLITQLLTRHGVGRLFLVLTDGLAADRIAEPTLFDSQRGEAVGEQSHRPARVALGRRGAGQSSEFDLSVSVDLGWSSGALFNHEGRGNHGGTRHPQSFVAVEAAHASDGALSGE